ncbi:MAG: YggS family pyridoxal phosphate-dependent enzyme [Bacteroidetes bacterium]|nr:YggS family pyridoxal phosphate-dependent enzyme [Bacteroidota bacterium]
MSVKENLASVLQTIPPHVKFVAVSKTMPNEAIMEAFDAGQRHFGENKAQEIIRKQQELPSDIQWHFIGHLQTNKVKFIAPFVDLIESVDSLKLLREINKQGEKAERIVPCLLQFHIAEEETKFGLDLSEAKELIDAIEKEQMQNIQIKGVMGMATFTENEDQVRKEFKQLKKYFEIIKAEHFQDKDGFKEISMGMSGDYLIAIEEGSTIVRIGSSIFGERNYSK